MKWTRTERLSVWLLRFIPPPLAVAPERILINVACALIGISAFLPAPQGSVFQHWPYWVAIEWGVGMIAGGLVTLIGIWRQRLGLERLGLLLIAVCSVYFAADLLLVFHLRSFPSSLIFLGVAAAKVVRLIVSSAARAHVTHRPTD